MHKVKPEGQDKTETAYTINEEHPKTFMLRALIILNIIIAIIPRKIFYHFLSKHLHGGLVHKI